VDVGIRVVGVAVGRMKTAQKPTRPNGNEARNAIQPGSRWDTMPNTTMRIAQRMTRRGVARDGRERFSESFM
jgi:hypothetical protein